VYYERCKTIIEDLEATELELGSLGSAPRGTLRVTCPSWFAGQRMADGLAEFRRRYPEILVDISFEDRMVDLVEEGYDLALRVTRDDGSLPAGVIARPARSIPFYIAASHDYLKRNGVPQSPAELAHHDFVAIGNIQSLTLNGPGGKIEVPLRVVMRYRSAGGVANAVAAGIGLAPLADVFFDDPVFRDVLKPILTDYPIEGPKLYFVYVSRKYAPLKIRVFIDFMLELVSKFAAPKLASVR
jgi:DNA-binding transcriptional LysR family regulator